jgi:hypothetical protein
LCQETTPADTEAESCQVLSESCQVEDKCILEEEVVETVEQRESNLTPLVHHELIQPLVLQKNHKYQLLLQLVPLHHSFFL